MSDGGNPTPGLIGGLTQAEYVSAKTAWTAAGHSADAFDRGLGIAPGSVTMPASSTPSTPQPQPAYPPDMPGSNLTPQQIEGAVKALRASGVSASAIEEAIQKDGIIVAAEERTAEQVEHDAAWGMTPHDPSMYRPLDFRDLPGQQNDSLEERAQLDQEIREFAADLRLPVEIGSSFMEHLLNVSAKCQAMSPADREAWRVAGSKEIADMYSTPEELNEDAENIRTLIELPGADHPLVARLKSGILADKWAWQTLANVARHAVEWAGSRPDKVKK